jgi:hypothetical protein
MKEAHGMTKNMMVQPGTRRCQELRKDIKKERLYEDTLNWGLFIHQPIHN